MEPTPSKMAKFGENSEEMDKTKRQATKLWTHEGRLFNERIIYLNKSTSKHIIMGIDFNTFKAVMLLCDRVSGFHVPVLYDEVYAFFTNAEEIYLVKRHVTLSSAM